MRPALLNSGLAKTPSSQSRDRRQVTTSEARLRAEACLAAAKDEGIAREDIEGRPVISLLTWALRLPIW